MTLEHPSGDDVTQLAQRVERARGRLAYQFDPALTEALSEDELHAERELAERIRGQERGQRWKQAQAAAAAADRARQTTEEIEKADIRDLLVARKAIAAQRRESSPHAKLASLYRHRSWSLRALAGVVGAGMLWSAVNVQHNIAPGGPSDPLYWFSYLLEGMISVCLIIIMIGTNKVAEWGVVDNRRQVAVAEFALLALTVTLNTYPYVRDNLWYDAAVHAIAPVMIGVALLIHNAASGRFGLAISRATDQVRDMPDPAEQIRRTVNSAASYRVRVPSEVRIPPQDTQDAEITELEPAPVQALEAAAEGARKESDSAEPKAAKNTKGAESKKPAESGAAQTRPPGNSARTEKAGTADPFAPAVTGNKGSGGKAGAGTSGSDRKSSAATESKSARPAAKSSAAAGSSASGSSESGAGSAAEKPAAVTKSEPKGAPKTEVRSTSSASARRTAEQPVEASTRPAAATTASGSSASKAVVKSASARGEEPARQGSPRIDASAANDIWTAKPVERPSAAPSKRQAAADAKRAAEAKKAEAKRLGTGGKNGKEESGSSPSDLYDTGQMRIAEILEQELAELQAQRRKARTSRQRLSQQSGRDR